MPREKRGPYKKRSPSAPPHAGGGRRRVGRPRSLAPVPAPAAVQEDGGITASTAARSAPSSEVIPAGSAPNPVISAPSANQVATEPPLESTGTSAAASTIIGGEFSVRAPTGLAPPNSSPNELSAQESRPLAINAGRVAGNSIQPAIQAPTVFAPLPLELPVSQADGMFSLSTAAGMGAARPSTLYSLGNDAPIDMHVPRGVKEKIWNGQYVDLACLYRDTATRVLTARETGSELTMAVEQGKVVFRAATPHTRKLDSIDKWTSAFHVFMAIYCTRHPSRFLELLKYAEIIRTAAVQFPGIGWRNYDEQFRLRMEANPSRSWAAMDMELWVTVAAAGSMLHSPNVGALINSIQSPKYVCYAFNSATGCRWNPCRYSHSCSRCGKTGHGAGVCRMGGAGMAPQGNPVKQSFGTAGASYTRYTKTPAAASGVRQAVRQAPISAGLQVHAPAGAQTVASANKGGTHSFRASNTR